MKLNLYYPAQPYRVTQAFGISNPSYEKFGFNKHNGIDFAVDDDGIVRAMCDGVVYEALWSPQAGGFNPGGAGNSVRIKTVAPFMAEGRLGVIGFMYMHAKEVLVKNGQRVSAGDPIIVADNTGFSTGPHTHISAYFLDPRDQKLPVGDPASDYCFDFSKYYNGKYSDDLIVALQRQVLSLMIKILALFKK